MEVSILVLVDGALEAANSTLAFRMYPVSILVLVDGALEADTMTWTYSQP